MKYLYVGWKCKNPDCDDEIHFRYIGIHPVSHKKLQGMQLTVPNVIVVKCRSCGQTHDYSQERPQNFLSTIPPTHHQRTN